MQYTWLSRLAAAALLVASLLNVLHARAQTAPLHETRAVWFATVLSDGNWPESPIDPPAKQEADLRARIRTAAANGINTFIFQVVGRGDAVYPSERLPWSGHMRGPGQDPGYDPLAVAVDEAHKLGIELHAWVNVFRVGDESTVEHFIGSEPEHVYHAHPEWVKNFNGQLWLDPSSPEARQWMIDNVLEIVRNYDVDAVHYDFIRYPETGLPDDLQSCLFQTGSCPDIDQWRRDNVTAFVVAAQEAIYAEKPWVKIGATPIGHYENDYPWGHLSGYHDVFQASREWVPGSVDYLAPQIYWSIGQDYDPPRFEVLAQEWIEETDGPVFVGIAAYGADSTAVDSPFPALDLPVQIGVSRELGAKGQVFFRYDHFLKYIQYIDTEYRFAALPAQMTHRFEFFNDPSTPTNLELTQVGLSTIQLTWTPSEGSADNPVRGYAIFRKVGGAPDVSSAVDLFATVGATTYSEGFSEPPAGDVYYRVVAVSSLGSTSEGSEAMSTASVNLAADTELPATDFRLLSIYPNPTSSNATLEFQLNGPADVAIRVFDTLGREVVRGFEGYLAGGQHEIQLDLTSLSAGTYLVELRTDRGQIVRQVVKI